MTSCVDLFLSVILDDFLLLFNCRRNGARTFPYRVHLCASSPVPFHRMSSTCGHPSLFTFQPFCVPSPEVKCIIFHRAMMHPSHSSRANTLSHIYSLSNLSLCSPATAGDVFVHTLVADRFIPATTRGLVGDNLTLHS